MFASPLPTYCYRVDAGDHLVWVDKAWLAFARENGASGITEQSVLGRSLWSFLADDGTRALYRQIHNRIRETQKSVVLPVRCDSPNLKRFMQLAITPEPSGNLHYRSVLVRVELQRQLAVLDARARRSSDQLKMCSCCMKVHVEPGGWVELETVAAAFHLFDNSIAPRLCYSVCHDCVVAAAKSNVS